MRMSNLNRRSVLAGLAASASFLPFSAQALTGAEARNLIDAAVGEINVAVNSGKADAAVFSDFERIFRRYADVSTISRSVLGPPARSASNSQISAFADAFITYAARKYGSRFKEFKGSEIEVVGTREVKSFFEVQATVQLRGQSPFSVGFMVSDRTGKDLFFDLLIEGISLLKAERAEIGALYDKSGRDIGKLTQSLGASG